MKTKEQEQEQGRKQGKGQEVEYNVFNAKEMSFL